MRKDSLLLGLGPALLLSSGLPLFKCGPPPLGRTICFTQALDVNVHPKHPIGTPRILFDQISGHPMAQPELAQEINHQHGICVCSKCTQRIPMSDEGGTEAGRVRDVLANGGVLIFLAPRSPGLARGLSHSEPKPLQPDQEDRQVLTPHLQQVPGGFSLQTLPPASAAPGPQPSHPLHGVCCPQHFPSPILNTLATIFMLAGGDYIFHGERERKNLTKGIVSPLFP